jgi:hypothetical protein
MRGLLGVGAGDDGTGHPANCASKQGYRVIFPRVDTSSLEPTTQRLLVLAFLPRSPPCHLDPLKLTAIIISTRRSILKCKMY